MTNEHQGAAFDAILAPLSDGEAIAVPPGWGQGRATFGGLVAAMLYRRARAVAAHEDAGAGAPKPARSLAFSLVAPVAPGDARVEARVLRAGKSVTHVEARLVQGDAVGAAMLASFGAARPSEISVAAPAPPAYPSPATLPALPYAPGLTPEFTQHFDMRWAHGTLPFTTPATTGDIGGWVRFRSATREVGVEHVLALVDAWPPAVLPMLRKPAPVSTLSWTLDFTGAPAGEATEPTGEPAYFGYAASTDHASDGYALIGSRFFRADGTLLAVGRQTVAAFG